jgi:hypothetical protein
MIHGFILPPLEARPSFVQLLHRRRVTGLIVSDYELAEENDAVLQLYRTLSKQEDDRLTDSERIDILYQRWLQLQRDQDEVNEQWDQKTAKFSQEDQAKFDELTGRHEKEQEKFNAYWRDVRNLRQFTKPSPRLLQLREQERAMAVSRLYGQARNMKEYADKVQREETDAAQQRMARQIAIDRQKMQNRQGSERNRHLSHRRSVLNTMEYERSEQLRPLVSAMTQIRAKKGAAMGTRPSTAMSQTRRSYELATPRTQQQYVTYRAQKKVARLSVQPVADPLKPESRRGRSTRTARRPESAQTSAPSEILSEIHEDDTAESKSSFLVPAQEEPEKAPPVQSEESDSIFVDVIEEAVQAVLPPE